MLNMLMIIWIDSLDRFILSDNANIYNIYQLTYSGNQKFGIGDSALQIENSGSKIAIVISNVLCGIEHDFNLKNTIEVFYKSKYYRPITFLSPCGSYKKANVALNIGFSSYEKIKNLLDEASAKIKRKHGYDLFKDAFDLTPEQIRKSNIKNGLEVFISNIIRHKYNREKIEEDRADGIADWYESNDTLFLNVYFSKKFNMYRLRKDSEYFGLQNKNLLDSLELLSEIGEI